MMKYNQEWTKAALNFVAYDVVRSVELCDQNAHVASCDNMLLEVDAISTKCMP